MRFTDDVQDVFYKAIKEAIMLNHNYVGTEHVLWGVAFAGTSELKAVLRSLGVTPVSVDDQIHRIIGRGINRVNYDDMIKPTPRVRAVLEGSVSIARELRSDHIDSSILTLSLIREIGVSAQILQALRVDTASVARRILHKAGMPQREINEWLRGIDAYQNDALYKQFTDFTQSFNRLRLTLPEGIRWR